jgi:hypothetical protein
VDYVLRPNEIARELSRMSRFNKRPRIVTHRVPPTSAIAAV